MTILKKKKRVLLYGGTFNPIHNGHLYPISQAVDIMNFNKVEYIPCFVSPHKTQPELTAKQRVELTTLAVNCIEFGCEVSVSDYEAKRDEPSFTINTIKHFMHVYDGASLFIAIGFDSLINLSKWYQWEEILELVNIVVVARKGVGSAIDKLPSKIKQSVGSRIHILETELHDISSTDIRKMLSASPINDKELAQVMPQPVLSYLIENNPYKLQAK
jgi:nicotinate-nucleotide adenylyltransferase